MHALRGGIHSIAAGLFIIRANASARLHCIDHHTRHSHEHFGDMRCRGKSLFDFGAVAKMIIQRNIAGHIIENLRRIGRNGLLHHAGEGIADIGDFSAGQCKTLGLEDGRAIAAIHRNAIGIGAIGIEIVSRIDSQNTGHGFGGAHINGFDQTMRIVRARHSGIGLAGQIHIIGINAFAAHELGVFAAQNWLADREFLQGQLLIIHMNCHAGILSEYLKYKSPL